MGNVKGLRAGLCAVEAQGLRPLGRMHFRSQSTNSMTQNRNLTKAKVKHSGLSASSDASLHLTTR